MTRLRNFLGFILHLFFVVRAKSNLKCKFCKWKRRMPKHIFSDVEVKLIGYTSEKKYPELFRVICFYNEENAVWIQISVAIITYYLVSIVQHDMQLNRSTYEILQILNISPAGKTTLRYLFDKTNFNDVKE